MKRWHQAFWVLFVVTGVVYVVIAGWSLPTIAGDAGGLPAFDLRPAGYSFDEARAFLAALTTAGYGFYLDVQQSLDTVYPALYGATLFFEIYLLAPRAWGDWRWLVALVGVPPAVFDYLENAAVAALLRTGPDHITAGMVETASRWTIFKSGATTVAALLVLVLLGMKVLAARRRRPVEPPAAKPNTSRYGERLRKWTES
jgi:hypothetical protein